MTTFTLYIRGLREKIALFERAEREAAAEIHAANINANSKLEKDMRGGVGIHSGALVRSINARLISVNGWESRSQLETDAKNKGYLYPIRLDKAGKHRWRSGRFRGRRTWGWWSWSGPKVARKIFQRQLNVAARQIVKRLEAAQ